MLGRITDKILREMYRLFHPNLWGKNTQINGLPRIYDNKNLAIGKNVSINSGCVLQCYGSITIGNNVTISDGAKILTRSLDNSNYLANAERPERVHVDRPVIIGDGVWIAANVVVLPGVSIAAKSIVAAGSIVTKNLNEEGCLYGGSPAHIIKKLQ